MGRPLLLSGRDIANVAPPLAEIIAIVESTYRAEALGPAQIPPKQVLHTEHGTGFLHAMPASIAGVAGLKWVSYFPENSARGLPDSSALIVLNDAVTGLPEAIMEGMWITYARTSACAAVAARHLARANPRRLGLVGCGGLGEWSLRALTTVFPSIERVHVASLRPQSRAAFCGRMAGVGSWQIRPVEAVRDAVVGMDIVVTSTPKLDQHPIEGEWWSPGCVMIPLDVTGAWDDAVYRDADRLVNDGPGNLRNAFARYRPTLAYDEVRTVGLQDIVAGRAVGRRHDAERILAFVTGIASTDLTVAAAILERAIQRGIGARLDLD